MRCVHQYFYRVCIHTNLIPPLLLHPHLLFFLNVFCLFKTQYNNFQPHHHHPAINETLHAKPGEKEVQYKEEKTEQWSNTVMDKCLAKLAGRESKYKYSVTCVLMQKNGAGLVTSSSQYWEKHDADLYVPVPWENNTIHCIVTIFVRLRHGLEVATIVILTPPVFVLPVFYHLYFFVQAMKAFPSDLGLDDEPRD